MHLDDLLPVFGGQIRETADHIWLDTEVGGLRSFVIRRSTKDGGHTFDLAVFTLQTRELDPFFSRSQGDEWWLGEEPVELPRLKAGVVFAGCRRGILFATTTTDPSIESLVTALWDLAHWARKPWCPVDGKSGPAHYRKRERERVERLRHVRRNQWIIVGGVVLVVAFGLWWFSGWALSLLSLLSLLAFDADGPGRSCHGRDTVTGILSAG
jgi:hypothetical protein